MTQFALGIWVFQETGKATTYAAVGALYLAVMILFGPIAGVFVDRWKRKTVLIISDLMSGVTTIIILLLLLLDTLEIWHLFAITGITGFFSSFQWIAFSATIPLIVSKENLTRANSVLGLVQSLSTMVAPIVAAVLLPVISLVGILAIDIVTFTLAVIGLMVISIPDTGRNGRKQVFSVVSELKHGWRYLQEKKELIVLQSYLFSYNFFFGLIEGVLFPMILIYTSNNELIVGQVGTAIGLGALAGGFLMSLWGGPKNLIKGTLIGMILGHLCGPLFLGIGHNTFAWIIGGFLLTLFSPLASNCVQSIWQNRVAAEMHGRVFGIRRLLSGPATPLGMVAGGFLADNLFEPFMQSESTLQALIGRVIGSSPGSGMALIILVGSAIGALVASSGFLSKNLRSLSEDPN